jgi:hypothetical protein
VKNSDKEPVSQHIILPPYYVSIRITSVRKIARQVIHITCKYVSTAATGTSEASSC